MVLLGPVELPIVASSLLSPRQAGRESCRFPVRCVLRRRRKGRRRLRVSSIAGHLVGSRAECWGGTGRLRRSRWRCEAQRGRRHRGHQRFRPANGFRHVMHPVWNVQRARQRLLLCQVRLSGQPHRQRDRASDYSVDQAPRRLLGNESHARHIGAWLELYRTDWLDSRDCLDSRSCESEQPPVAAQLAADENRSAQSTPVLGL